MPKVNEQMLESEKVAELQAQIDKLKEQLAQAKDQPPPAILVTKPEFDPEKFYEVRLSLGFPIPRKNKVPITGAMYRRGGYTFGTKASPEAKKEGALDGVPAVVVPGSEMPNFLLPKNQQFKNSPLEYQIDPYLEVREVTHG